MAKNVVENLVGKVFGPWTVVGLISCPSADLHHCRWLCKCICGNTKIRSGTNIKRSRHLKSYHCGFSHRCRPYEALFNTIRHLAKRRNIPVTLTYEEYLEFTKEKECRYCREGLLWEPFNKVSGHHLDRKDNFLGYTKENCVICCGPCNQTKSDRFTYEQMLIIGDLIRSWRQK